MEILRARGSLDLGAPLEQFNIESASGGSWFIQGSNIEGTARLHLDIAVDVVTAGGLTVVLNGQDRELSALADEWKRTRPMMSSSVLKWVVHPAYQRIIGKGRAAIPFILGELQREPDHWFWALQAITGIDPVSEGDRGDIAAMARAWIGWGRQSGYI